MGYNFVKNRRVNKIQKEKIKKINEFPKLECVKEIISPEDGETVLVEIGELCEVKRTSIKDSNGNEFFDVYTKKAGLLLLTKIEIEDYFIIKNNIDLNNAPFRDLGVSKNNISVEMTKE